MKIKDVRTVVWQPPVLDDAETATRESWIKGGPVANPMTRYPRYSDYRPSWQPDWGNCGVVVEAEDGTMGFSIANHAGPVSSIINDHLGPKIVGENCMAIEKVWDMVVRMTSLYGSTGLASYAVSAIDLAMWDLKGKILGLPVYELLGGPSREDIFVYATGGDTDWHMELGFKGTKLPCPYGPVDGIEGLHKNVELVEKTRELVGSDVEVMLDCWMAFDVEYCVRIAEELRPYNLKWLEDVLVPEDFDGFESVRARLPWQTLATGEHWYTTYPFQYAASHRLVDIFQPDIQWVGGLTAITKICAIAEAANIAVIPHGGGNTAYGQHACHALPAIPWAECFISTPPGVPLADASQGNMDSLGQAVPSGGRLKPTGEPGFGLKIDPAQLAHFRG